MPSFCSLFSSEHLYAIAVGYPTNHPDIPWLKLTATVAIEQRCFFAVGGLHGMHFVTWVSNDFASGMYCDSSLSIEFGMGQ